MHICHTRSDLRAFVAQQYAQQKTIAFVPTMGNLHAGHIALVQEAHAHGQTVIASVFVNPLQFGVGEDLDKYPRTLAQDIEKLTAAGCHALFAPTVDEMYPQGAPQIQVHSGAKSSGISITDILCGAHRPGHFDGVCTVVMKLLNLVQPQVMLLGQKDYQQVAVLRLMVQDLDVPTRIVVSETVREHDGLALSSRNQFLNEAERELAPLIYRTLQTTRNLLQKGSRDYTALEAQGIHALNTAGFRTDYYQIRARYLFAPTQGTSQFVVVTAARWGATRLIDNVLA